MRYYETLVLVNPQATEDTFNTIQVEFAKVVTKHGGVVDRFDLWGKYNLAYPVRRNVYGFYILIRYKTEDNAPELCRDLDNLLFIKLNEPVMRHTHVKLTSTEYAAEYIKPEPMVSGQTVRAQEESPRTSESKGANQTAPKTEAAETPQSAQQ